MPGPEFVEGERVGGTGFAPCFFADGTEIKSDASQQKQKTATNTPRIFSHYDAESFQKLEEAQQKIEPDHVNHDLLSAAVFHETNQRRLTEKLPPLDYP